MKKFISIPVMAVVAAVLLSVTMSSFRNAENKSVIGNTYFKFDETISPSEDNLELDPSWSVVSLPGSNPCSNGTVAPCIVHVDNTAASINAGDNNATRVTKFVTYLKAQSSAQAFVTNSSNYDYRRP